MTSISTDDIFNLDHPKNFANGKWNRLVLLSSNDPYHLLVERHFQTGWVHPHKSKPQVQAVFKILSTSESLKKYERYRAKVAVHPKVAHKKVPGNERLLFHGTARCCLLAEDSSRVRLCNLPECYLCCVIRSSFEVQRCGTRNKFRRFGTGIYTSECSSKADDYSCNKSDDANFRVMLANRVVVGKARKQQENAEHLTEPPKGYHSVIGKPGLELNYPETVVYDNDAIRPAFLIVYGTPEASEKKDPKRLRNFITTLFNTPIAS
ncbi:hypothetical protein BDZ94DRAFT_1257762 [Collybia nuda]|uniref:Poly [ADP-ribose] polymerase n=1 Tax=Collybia nuda TaxID=64659 RepID=A0A9P5Y833_9AGAR|nr:hypothetical protein BDZ94DRAFT_1257762 [Collybia nuda]